MNTYSYTLATKDIEATVADQEIRDFVVAKNITDAYTKVITIISDLNKITSDYKWTLKAIENCYFVGIDGKNDVKCDCCEDNGCDCANS